MCRLFAQHATPSHDLGEPLCTAPNALRTQSHKHPHGWGVGWYAAGHPRVRRGIIPAHADEAFVEAARAARSEIVIAHVRDASVGPIAEVNTHPFVHGPWLFAHNGTVARFRASARVRADLEAEIDPALRRRLRGETDSERVFFLFLTRLAARVAPGSSPALTQVRSALRDTIALVTRFADAGTEKPSSLNLVVSNGEVLALCRWGRTLHALADIDATGVFAVASERIGGGPWTEVPEGGFVGIDPEHRVLAGRLNAGGRAAA